MKKVLVVDLDGTLIRSDMLFESLWSALGQNRFNPLQAVAALRRGKAALKRYLADCSSVDVARLPYDSEVIAYIKKWRADGGRTALVTASDAQLAQAIAQHLALFDEVHGSNGELNLKGTHKATFVQDRFGRQGFAYIGDSPADLAVWELASRAITVNAAPRLRAQVAKIAPEVEHLTTQTKSARPYFAALRPHQAMKNILVFLPMLAAHQIDGAAFFSSLLAFIAFSLFASSVYVLNDMLDLSADRAHPRKCNRPFASGSIPLATGVLMALGLLVLGAFIAVFIGPLFLLMMVGYYALTTAYSLYIKRKMIIDICVLAGLYTLRILAGAVATGIPPSIWLLAFSLFFFLSLAAVKRQAELVDSAAYGKLTATGRGYHVNDLPIISMIALSAGYVAVLVMALYVNSPTVTQLYAYPQALWGVCVVLLYWITRTIMLAHRGGMHDDPVIYAVGDTVSRICFMIILGLVLAGALP